MAGHHACISEESKALTCPDAHGHVHGLYLALDHIQAQPHSRCLAGVGPLPVPSCCMWSAKGGRWYSDPGGRWEESLASSWEQPGFTHKRPPGKPGERPSHLQNQRSVHLRCAARREMGTWSPAHSGHPDPSQEKPRSDKPLGWPQTGPPRPGPHAEGTRRQLVSPGHAGFRSNFPTAPATELTA